MEGSSALSVTDLQETGKRRIIALGAVRESYDAVDDCHTMPGWDSGTVGYHVYHGKIFETGCRKKGREVEGMVSFKDSCLISATRFTEVSPLCN